MNIKYIFNENSTPQGILKQKSRFSTPSTNFGRGDGTPVSKNPRGVRIIDKSNLK